MISKKKKYCQKKLDFYFSNSFSISNKIKNRSNLKKKNLYPCIYKKNEWAFVIKFIVCSFNREINTLNKDHNIQKKQSLKTT